MKIYKRNQGKNIRIATAVGVIVMSGWGSYSLKETLEGYGVGTYLTYGIALALLVGMGLLVLWFVNRAKSADFLIATEGEMKKVSWSSREEVIGSTKVVIVTTLIMAALLFLVDFAFANFFRLINITI
jgi:preprotein translocase subunit SecE